MKPLEKKLQETIKDGALVSKGMQPLAKRMLQTLKTKPSNLSVPSPTV
jgi:hypothetical protein